MEGFHNVFHTNYPIPSLIHFYCGHFFYTTSFFAPLILLLYYGAPTILFTMKVGVERHSFPGHQHAMDGRSRSRREEIGFSAPVHNSSWWPSISGWPVPAPNWTEHSLGGSSRITDIPPPGPKRQRWRYASALYNYQPNKLKAASVCASSRGWGGVGGRGL